MENILQIIVLLIKYVPGAVEAIKKALAMTEVEVDAELARMKAHPAKTADEFLAEAEKEGG